MMQRIWSDIRFAVTSLLRNRTFAVAAILALTLGIGANTAIFSVLHSIVLNPLPYEDPEELAMIWTTPQGDTAKDSVVPANFMDWRREARSFEEMAGFFPFLRLKLFTGDRAEVVVAASVTGNFFDTLGVDAARGQVFTEAGAGGDTRMVVLGHELWQNFYNGDPGIVGRSIELNKEPYNVLGVMEQGFSFPTDVDLWVRAPADVPQLATDMPRERLMGIRYMRAFGRLAEGVTLEQARSEMGTITRALENTRPEKNAGRTTHVLSLHEETVGDVRPALLVLMAMVSFVLLIACVNAASLLMARATSRQREIAVRIAIGAGRPELMRQLIVEGILMAMIAGGLALVVARGLLSLLVRFDLGKLPRLQEVGLDPTVLAFTFVPALLIGILFGLMPALQTWKQELVGALKEGGRQMAESVQSGRLRSVMLAVEVALAVVLLIGTGLMLRSFLQLQQVDLGFEPADKLVFRVNLEGERYSESFRQRAFYRQAGEQLAALPGVEGVATILRVPFPGDQLGGPIFVEGRPMPPESQRPNELLQAASPDYFELMGIDLVSGRTFTDRDGAEAPDVAVISQEVARRYFPGEDPVGQRITHDDPTQEGAVWWRIVGVVEDVRHFGLDEPKRAELYFPQEQWTWNFADLVIATQGDPNRVLPQVRRVMKGLDPELALTDVSTLQERVDTAAAQPRFTLFVTAAFAVLAGLLAMLGIYGLISYTMAQRRNEVGLRMALGAERGDILRHVLRLGLVPTLVGIGLGLVGAFILRGLMSRVLYDVSGADPMIYGVVAVLALLVSAGAILIPAWRTSRTDPTVALRSA